MSNSTLPNAPPCCATRTSRYVMFVSLAVGGCLVDLISKSIVFARLGDPSPGSRNIYWLWEGYFGLETALNKGALFGLGEGMIWLFAAMSFVAIAGIVYWLNKGAVDDWLLTLTLGVVTGGICGNLYDRLGLWSDFTEFAVRDWIRFSIPVTDATGIMNVTRYVWPNFNIADSLLVCGAALLVWHSYQYPDPLSEKSE